MIKILLARLRQGHRTMGYPAAQRRPCPIDFAGACTSTRPVASATAAFAGKPARRRPSGLTIRPSPPPRGWTSAAAYSARICAMPARTMRFATRATTAWRPGRREDLVVGDGPAGLAEPLDKPLLRILGRSLRLRQVSAGGCNACEADTNVLGTVGWDIGRFGIQFVASPRHADGLLVTGPVTENMKLALEKTYQAVPSPKIVIAAGAGDLRRPIRRTRRGSRRRGLGRARGSLRSRLPATSAHHPRRTAQAARKGSAR